jgi:hypothetical protein
MQCPVCEKTFAIELSVCPSCGSMPSQHSQVEASLRLLSIEKIKTSELELELEDQKEVQAAISAELLRPKHEYSSTLIEFPARRGKNPEWRDEIKNRVRLSQERRRTENAQEAEEKLRLEQKQNAEKSAPAPPQPTEPALVINLVPNITENRPAQKIVARALERIERSRQNLETIERSRQNVEGIQTEFAASEFKTSQMRDLQMAEVSVTNESRINDSPLSLVTSRSETAAVTAPQARRVLPLIEDDSIG